MAVKSEGEGMGTEVCLCLERYDREQKGNGGAAGEVPKGEKT